MEKQIYNTKRFLLPYSHRSMSCYHAKVMEDGIMKLTIHDCRNSIQLKNDLNNIVEIEEAIEKLNNLAAGIIALKEFIVANYKNEMTFYVSNHFELIEIR
jgi:hypothetical protein